MKVALITGGSRGIGKAIAHRLATLGFDVAVVGRDIEKLRETVSGIEAKGQRGEAILADLEEESAPQSIVEQCISRFGQLDVLVNNAGITLSGSFTEVTPTEWDRIFRINAKAPFFLCKEALPYLKQSEKPVIINIGSVVGFKGYAQQSAYSSSKHALTGFTKVLAKEVQPFGIRVHLISPGGVGTEMVSKVRPDINIDELISPEEIAELAGFLVTCEGKGIIDHLYIRRYSGLAFD
jgi:3-oxoacyl-[acyl-carrier protein] reductase